MNTILRLSLIAALLWISLTSTRAEVTWRVSVKLILGPSGQRPGNPAIANSQIQAQFDFANTNKYLAGRGLQLENTEIVQVTPPANASRNWFTTDLAPSATRIAFEAEAKANPAYAWRTEPIRPEERTETNL